MVTKAIVVFDILAIVGVDQKKASSKQLAFRTKLTQARSTPELSFLAGIPDSCGVNDLKIYLYIFCKIQ